MIQIHSNNLLSAFRNIVKNKVFSILNLLAILVASPITWLTVSKWQENYPYKAGINLPGFLVTGFLVIFFAVLAVVIQTIRAANTNPAQSLKYE